MEVTRSKRRPRVQQVKKKHDLIVQRWLELGRPAVDAQFLDAIQKELTARFGHHESESPAAIARVLADEDAELRHPEILELDAQWRESQINSQVSKFDQVGELASGERLNFERAEALITKLERLRQRFLRNRDEAALKELKMLAVDARQSAQARAESRGAGDSLRSEQAEIVEWLKVWLQTPALFKDWLDLRRRSVEFRKTFPE